MKTLMEYLGIIVVALFALGGSALVTTIFVDNPAQAEVTATGSACSQVGCAYTRHQRRTLCSEDHARDGHEYRAQGILRSGEQVTVRDGSGSNPGVGCTNPRGGGKFKSIRGGWPGHWTSWRPA